MNTAAAAELDRYPKYKQAYLKAFKKMLEKRKEAGLPCTFENEYDVMDWWLYGATKHVKQIDGQIELGEIETE